MYVGFGSLIFGLSLFCSNKTVFLHIKNKFKYIIYGIIQITGFTLLLVYLIVYEENQGAAIKYEYLIIYIIGGISYCFSIYTGIKILSLITCCQQYLFFD